MPEGPQWAGLGWAQLDLVGAAIAAPQAVPAHRLQWGGMAGLGVGLGLVHVLGHVLRLRLGLSKTQNKKLQLRAWWVLDPFRRLTPLVAEASHLAAERVLRRLRLFSIREPGLVVRVLASHQRRVEMPLQFLCGLVHRRSVAVIYRLDDETMFAVFYFVDEAMRRRFERRPIAFICEHTLQVTAPILVDRLQKIGACGLERCDCNGIVEYRCCRDLERGFALNCGMRFRTDSLALFSLATKRISAATRDWRSTSAAA